MKNNKKMSGGITLIALVVTIIVLLILAGISIGMLSGNNGILTQTSNAKLQTDMAEEKEILQMSVLSAISKEKYGDINKEKLDIELDANIGNTNYSSDLADDGISVTFIKSGRTYLIDNDGNIEKVPEATGIASLTVDKTTIDIGNTAQLIATLEPEKSIGTVTYISSDETVATVNNSGVITGIKDGSVTITATLKGTSKTLEITVNKVDYAIDKLLINGSSSPYVNYPAKDGSIANKILCQVLYDKNSAYGLQIVSVNPVTKVKLGHADENINISGNDNFEKAVSSYNRAIQTLNEKAEEYLENKGIANDARCVGSDPRPGHKNDEAGSTEYSTNDYGNVDLKNADINYITDTTALSNIGAYRYSDTTNGEYYWLASRENNSNNFDIRHVGAHGSMSYGGLCTVYSDGRVRGQKYELGFRPVFYLNSGVKIVGGTGTQENPYEIDI